MDFKLVKGTLFQSFDLLKAPDHPAKDYQKIIALYYKLMSGLQMNKYFSKPAPEPKSDPGVLMQ